MNIAYRHTSSSKLSVVVFAFTWIFYTLASVPVTRAQGLRVTGTVRDTSGSVVQGAEVELRGKSHSATASTDASGAFIFDNVTDMSGTVVFRAKGFQEVQRSWAASSGVVHLDINLSPSEVEQQILVTAARTPTPVGETPVSDIELTKEDVQATPALALDDILRQDPGFSLYRRSSSRSANPTTEGVSLRGLGSSGASRALILEDGIPLNDPFGKWIYWDRIPTTSVANIEIAQEGASSLYGSDALGGVVQVLTRPPEHAGIAFEMSYGNQNTPDFSLWAGGTKGRWESRIGTALFHTDGYVLVPQADRGSVDQKAGSEDISTDLMIGRKFGESDEVFARGWLLEESRQNGTPLTTNDTHLGEGALGANLKLGNEGTLTLRSYGDFQTYHQSFSSVALNRNSESLTDLQTVPAQGIGASAVWSRTLGKRQTLVAGFDTHEEIGHSNERTFSAGNPLNLTFAGGRQRTVGVFGEDLIQISPTWVFSASARYDNWNNFDAAFTTIPVAHPTAGVTTPFAEKSYNAFSPRLSLMHQFSSNVSWSASAYRAFRAPSLNELYRSFRQGNTLTNANANLNAERLTGGETGVNVNGFRQRLEVRGTFFFNEIIDPIANVTLSTTPTLITRQRQNLGRTSAPGFEINTVAHLTSRIQFSAGYQFVDAKVISYPANTSLVGLWVAEVPRNVLTFQGRYTDPSHIDFTIEGRMVGKQFDDDQNQFPLAHFFVLDAMASRNLRGGFQLFAACENLLNEKYAIEATPTPNMGLPIAARFGFRYESPARK
jgi:outer membrane receptor protein involved in Fe transport